MGYNNSLSDDIMKLIFQVLITFLRVACGYYVTYSSRGIETCRIQYILMLIRLNGSPHKYNESSPDFEPGLQ